MVADMGYYRLVRHTDPSYTPRETVWQYLSENRDVAVDICYYLSAEGTIDDMPFGFEELKDYLSGMDLIDILSLGIHCRQPFDFNGYFQFEGDGNLRSMTEREYLSWCFSQACEYYIEICEGKIPVPAEMNRVLDLWRDPPSNMKVDYNRKPAPEKKSVKKAPAKKATIKKKSCSTKKVVSKNVKAKAPPKKPTPAAKKKTARRAA